MRFNDIVNSILEQNVSRPLLSQRDQDILATLLVREAGGEKDYIAGMAGVMNVIVNRAKKNPANFIKEATRKLQFSAFNNIKTPQQMDQLIAITKKHKAYAAAKEMVVRAIQGKLQDITGSSTHYYAASGPNEIMPPGWADPTKKTNKIGHHQFFSNIR